MKLFISGPMRGIEHLNEPEFTRVANRLEFVGHTAYNPAVAYPNLKREDIRKAMTSYCRWITTRANGIVMLDGWTDSEGSKIEHGLAVICGLRVFRLSSYEHLHELGLTK